MIGGKRWPIAFAGVLVMGMPTAAYCLAPVSAHAAHAQPAANLGGFNSDALSAAIQVQVDLPGIAPLGDATKGNFIQVEMPYASTSTSTGPTTSGSASPVYPGPVVSNAGNDLQTFEPSLPQALVNALNYPIIANSVYPSQVHVKTTGKYSAPGASAANIGTATTSSSKSDGRSNAVLNNTSPLGSLTKSSPLAKVLGGLHPTGLSSLGLGSAASSPTAMVKVGSATSTTTSHIAAGSVTTTARTDVSNIVVAGLIKIGGVSSVATVTSDGKTAHQRTATKIGKVTVAGVPAVITGKGIQLQHKKLPLGIDPIGLVNKTLANLQKNGLIIRTVAPSHKVHGHRAEATSGTLQIHFLDKKVPSLQRILPQLPLPTPTAFGLDADLGLSQVSANATRLAPTKPIKTPKTHRPKSSGTSQSPPSTTSGGGLDGGSPPSTGGYQGGQPAGGQSSPLVAGPAADNVLGLPVRVAWLIIALLLSIMAAGPLLAYANWQLLRGRST